MGETRRLALRVAPQRNTQYQALARSLAEPEVRRSPLRDRIVGIEPAAIGDADYLLVDLDLDLDQDPEEDRDTVDARVSRVLAWLAATSDAFWVTDAGWTPIPVVKTAVVPRTMAEARRYSGKTNELFTRVLVNLAAFERWDQPVRLLDPMCGGGTTLFAALERGISVVGADADKAAVESTAQFIRQFCKEERVPCRQQVERAASRGRDWHHHLGDGRRGDGRRGDGRKGDGLTASLLQADLDAVADAMVAIPGGQRCHAVVADLPYGIQHDGRVAELVGEVLDVARTVLTGDGVAVLAWNASRLSGDDLMQRVDLTGLERDDTDDLAHRVDRVIKRREVLLLRRSR